MDLKVFDIDKFKGKGFSVDDYNNIKTLEFSYPFKDLPNNLSMVGCDNSYIYELCSLQGQKKKINIQFNLEDEKLNEDYATFIIGNPISDVLDFPLNYLSYDELEDIKERVNYIIENKDRLIQDLDYLDFDRYEEKDKFSNYTSGFEVGNEEHNIDKYSMGKKADKLPDLDDYDGNYEGDYYDR